MARPVRSSAPAPSAVLRRVRLDLEAGWPAGLTVLTGDDLYHLDSAQKDLLARLAPTGDSMALSVFAGDANDKVVIDDVVAAARSMGMFSDRRVVFVRDVANLEGDHAALEAYAKAPPAQSFLVLRAPKLDSRKAFHQMLASAGRLLEFRLGATQTRAEALAPITAMAKSLELALERGVAELLFESCSGDLHRVARELEKLDVWAGAVKHGVRTIRIEDAREVVSSGGLIDSWEVANALAARDSGRAIEAVRRLLNTGTVPYMLLGGLAWRARAMLQAAAAQQGPSAYSLKELLAFPARLHEADLALKSRGLDQRAVMETLVADLIHPTKGGAG